MLRDGPESANFGMVYVGQKMNELINRYNTIQTHVRLQNGNVK